jgi:hypothetical protein
MTSYLNGPYLLTIRVRPIWLYQYRFRYRYGHTNIQQTDTPFKNSYQTDTDTDTDNRYIKLISFRYIGYFTDTYIYAQLYQTYTDTYIYTQLYQTYTDTYTNFRIHIKPIPIWFHISRYRYWYLWSVSVIPA